MLKCLFTVVLHRLAIVSKVLGMTSLLLSITVAILLRCEIYRCGIKVTGRRGNVPLLPVSIGKKRFTAYLCQQLFNAMKRLRKSW